MNKETLKFATYGLAVAACLGAWYLGAFEIASMFAGFAIGGAFMPAITQKSATK